MRSLRSSIWLTLLLYTICFAQVSRNQVRTDAYGPTWSGDRARAGSADAVYDKIEALVLGALGPDITAIEGSDPIWNQMVYWTAPATVGTFTTTAFGRALLNSGNGYEHAHTSDNDMVMDANWFGVHGDGVSDDKTHLQNAINWVLASGQTLLLRKPPVGYRITDTLTVGTGTSVVKGFRWIGDGQPTIIWDGAADKTVLDVVSLEDAVIDGIRITGSDVAGVTGVTVRAAATFPTQRVTLSKTFIEHCPKYGVRVVQDALATCDYYYLDMVNFSYNGVNLRIEGDTRQVMATGGSFLNATTYAVDVNNGCFTAYNTLFARSGTSDLFLAGNMSALALYNTKHESDMVLTTGPTSAFFGPLVPPIVLNNVSQDLYVLPWTAEVAIDYNCYRNLTLTGCHFVGDVNVGTSSLGVVSICTDFVPFANSGINASFTGETDKVTELGVTQHGYANFYCGSVQIVRSPPWPDRFSILDLTVGHYQDFFSAVTVPASPYFTKGDIVWNFFGDHGDPIGWICTIDGDPGVPTNATFESMGPIGGAGAGTGDMLKATYDPGDDGGVDKIDAAANATVNAAGEISLDTTAGELVIGDKAGTARVYAEPNMVKSMTFFEPAAGWDNTAQAAVCLSLDNACTIYKIRATAVGSSTPTLTYNLEERAYASHNSAGTDVLASDAVADGDGTQSSSFANANIAAGAKLFFTTGTSAESGTVEHLDITLIYRIDRQ